MIKINGKDDIGDSILFDITENEINFSDEININDLDSFTINLSTIGISYELFWSN